MVDQTRWINHSCNPNCEVEVGIDPESGGWAQVVALRAVRAGEEIAYDYAFDPAVAEPCRCGSPLCRGFIVDEDAVHLVVETPAVASRRRALKPDCARALVPDRSAPSAASRGAKRRGEGPAALVAKVKSGAAVGVGG